MSFRSRRLTPVPPAQRPRRGRRATRVVVTDGVRVLLFADTDPGIPGSRWWVTPGGGIDEGETERDAGVREVFEETGLRVAASELVGPVMTRTVVHGYSDQVLTQHETFFVLRTEPFEGGTAGHTRKAGNGPAPVGSGVGSKAASSGQAQVQSVPLKTQVGHSLGDVPLPARTR